MTDLDLMSDFQITVMGWAAAIAWAYLITRWSVAWYRRRHPRRATYRKR